MSITTQGASNACPVNGSVLEGRWYREYMTSRSPTSRSLELAGLETGGPCVPEHFLAAISEREDRPCPRVELEPDNIAAANLFSLASSDHAGLVPLWFDTLTDGMDARESRAVISRVLRTLLDDQVALHFRRTPTIDGRLSR